MIPLGEKELFLRFFKTVDARVVGEVLIPNSQKQNAFTVSSERKHVRTGIMSCLVYGKDCQMGKLTAECIHAISFLCWQKSCHQRVTVWSSMEKGPSLAEDSTDE